MATIKFRLSAKSDPAMGKSEILVRFFHGRNDFYAKTNLFVTPSAWNESGQRLTIPKPRIMTQEVKKTIEEYSNINSSLESIKEYISQAFIKEGAGGVRLPKDWLEKLMDGFNSLPSEAEEKLSIISLYDKFIETKEFGPRVKAYFMVNKRALHRFLVFNGIDPMTALDDFTSDLVREFADYLKEEYSFYEIETDENGDDVVKFLNKRFAKAFKAVPESRLPQQRGQNSISGSLKRFREFYLWAVDNGYTTNDPFRKYTIPPAIYGTPYYITIEERNKLWSYDLSAKPSLAVQRDIFVFQCVIGCRVSDLMSLTKDCIIDGAVEYIPRKTMGERPDVVRVPLNSVARQILEKYKDTPGDKLLPCISSQNYNYAIKDIFKEVGLTRLVTILNPTTRMEEKRPLNEVASSHLARRCFIGNLYKQVKDPNLIGKLSGHKEGSKAFARYRDIDEDMRRDLVTMLE